MPLGKIDLAWMCSPKLVEGIENVTLADLTQLPLLIRRKGSVLRPILHGVIDNQTLPFKRTISCNNMAALAHLAGRGMGITLLPLAFFRQMVLDGKLCVVKSEMTLPTLEYFATFRNDYYVGFCEELRSFASSSATFTFQTVRRRRSSRLTLDKRESPSPTGRGALHSRAQARPKVR